MRVTISVVSGATSTDVLLDADGATPAVEVETALRRLARTPGGAVRVEHPLLGTTPDRLSWDELDTLADVGLVEGARVVLGERADPPGSGHHDLELHVVSGPDAGSVHPLPLGVHELGRSGAVSWQDHSLSRRHCRVALTPASAGSPGPLGVTDLGSSNGTRLDGAPCPPHETRPWSPGQVLAVGDSLVALRAADGGASGPIPTGAGRLVWHRPPPRPASYASPPPPDPARVGASATPAGRGWSRRWERRPDDPERLLLRLGTVGHHGAPVTLPLSGLAAGDVVALVGPEAAVDAALRWWLLQLGALHAPEDLSLDVAGPRLGPAWSWLRWLPHRADPDAARPHLSVRHGYADRRGGPAPTGPVVVTGPDVAALPERCAAVVEIGAHQPSYARLSRPGAPVQELRLDGVGHAWAERVARSLAPLVLPGSPVGPAAEPAPPGVRVRPLRWSDDAADWPSSQGRV